MTREDAERKIRAVFTNYFYFAGDREADEVIEALRQEPKYCDRNICIRNDYNGIGCGECEVTKSQEPREDAISREDTLARLRADTSFVCTGDKLQALETVNNMSPVTPQPKTGHWVFDEILDKHYYCSECKSMGVDYWDYCPNCGAKMEEGD